MLPNTPAMLEANFGVPMTGAVLHSINTRLDAANIAFLLDHAETKVLITDTEFSKVMGEALKIAKVRPTIVDYIGPGLPRIGVAAVGNGVRGFHRKGRPGVRVGHAGRRVGGDLAQLHVGHDRQSEGRGLSPPRRLPCVSWQRHRVRHGQACQLSLDAADVPLRWLVLRLDDPVVAGTQVCLRKVRPDAIFDAIAEHKVTHLCGAPIVMATLAQCARRQEAALSHQVQFMTAGGPAARRGARGDGGRRLQRHPPLRPDRDLRPRRRQRVERRSGTRSPRRAGAKKARQGVRYARLEASTVMDPTTMTPCRATARRSARSCSAAISS